jgi:hypothetical protein
MQLVMAGSQQMQHDTSRFVQHPAACVLVHACGRFSLQVQQFLWQSHAASGARAILFRLPHHRRPQGVAACAVAHACVFLCINVLRCLWCLSSRAPAAASLQIPYQVDIVRGCVDNDSIGALVCRRAEQVDAVAVVMAKHSRGTIK